MPPRPPIPWRRVRFLPRQRLRYRNMRRVSLLTAGILFFMWLLLPYDNTVRLAVRFNLKAVQATLTGSSRSGGQWVFAPPTFPVDLGEDTLVVVKTGYGTRDRLPAWFDALSPRSEFRDFLVIADYASREGEHQVYRGKELPVHDMVNRTLSHRALPTRMSHPRVVKYERLAEAIGNGEEELALQLSKTSGWELDALKFISGLELAYERFPKKKWFLLVDDDTYLVQTSLTPFLGHLNPWTPHYLGNAVGDYRARFAHGGSAIILSQAAMRLLLVKSQGVVSRAHSDSLSEVWGDRLLAKAMIRTGTYLDERYSHLFSGEPPRLSKIRADRFCSPILSFHQLATPAKMLGVGQQFGYVNRPVLWIDLWDLYQAPSPWRYGLDSSHKDWDHVGGPEEGATTVQNVATAEACIKRCEKKSRDCLAWTWDADTRQMPSRSCDTVSIPTPSLAWGIALHTLACRRCLCSSHRKRVGQYA